MENNIPNSNPPISPVPTQPVSPITPQQNNVSYSQADQSWFSKYKKFIILVLILVILGSLGAILWINKQYSNKNKAFYLSKDAQLDFKRGNYKNSEEKLRKALNFQSDPKLLAALIISISSEANRTGTEKNVYKNSESLINNALNLYPKDIDILSAVGYVYEIEGQYAKALTYYEKAIQINPNSSLVWFRKGHVLEFLQKQSDAYIAYDKAYSLDPNNGTILLAKGREAAAKAKLDDAYNFFIRAAENKDSDAYTKAEGYTNAAMVRRSDLTKIGDALSLNKKAVEANPNYAPGLAEYGMSLFFNGRRVEAIDYMDKAIKINPRITQNYYYLAGMLRSAKKYQFAIDLLKKGLNGVDNDNTLLSNTEKRSQKEKFTYEIAKTYSFSGGNPETIEYLKEVVRMDNSYKVRIKNDYSKYNYFKELSNTPDFLALIK